MRPPRFGEPSGIYFPDRLAEYEWGGAKQNFAEGRKSMSEFLRTYEIMFIVRPDVEEADLDKLIEGFTGNITSGRRRSEGDREDGPSADGVPGRQV